MAIGHVTRLFAILQGGARKSGTYIFYVNNFLNRGVVLKKWGRLKQDLDKDF